MIARYSAFCLTLVFILFSTRAFSQEWVNPQFPQWQKITIQEIKKITFDSYGTGFPGSVTNDYKKPTKVEGCPQYRDGKLIGWSMTCQGVK